jgi:hypothetical protein
MLLANFRVAGAAVQQEWEKNNGNIFSKDYSI